MNKSALLATKWQEKKAFLGNSPQKKQKKFWKNPFYGFSLAHNLSPSLIGYAYLLAKISGEQQSFTLSLGNDFLCKLWSCSRQKVWRIGKQLEDAGVIIVDSGTPQRKPDGTFVQEKKIRLIPQWKDEEEENNSHHSRADRNAQVAKMLHHNNNIPKECFRTIPSDRKDKPEGFVDLSSLKKYSDEEKRKPNAELKKIQARMLKRCLVKIMEEDVLDYRFMCLIYRKIFGAEEHNISHYQKMHFVLKHKPELVSSSFDLMIKTFLKIRCPIAWITSELKTIAFNPVSVNRNEEQPTKNILSKEAQAFMKRMENKE
tara:strand:+ start:1041 stop:1985 length:945 start_codon:yes stop_codon:yes gene_type:complete